MKFKVALDRSSVAAAAAAVQKQARFAAAQALTKTATAVRDQMPEILDKQLDKPTSFTKRGMFVRKATPQELQAVVGFMDRQAAYLSWQVHGGTRRPARTALRLPSEIKLDSHGNLPRGAIKLLVQQARGQLTSAADRRKVKRRVGRGGEDVFYGVPRGARKLPPGLWLRVPGSSSRGRKLKPLVMFPSISARYSQRFDFYGRGRRIAQVEFNKLFREALRGAIATAR